MSAMAALVAAGHLWITHYNDPVLAHPVLQAHSTVAAAVSIAIVAPMRITSWGSNCPRNSASSTMAAPPNLPRIVRFGPAGSAPTASWRQPRSTKAAFTAPSRLITQLPPAPRAGSNPGLVTAGLCPAPRRHIIQHRQRPHQPHYVVCQQIVGVLRRTPVPGCRSQPSPPSSCARPSGSANSRACPWIYPKTSLILSCRISWPWIPVPSSWRKAGPRTQSPMPHSITGRSRPVPWPRRRSPCREHAIATPWPAGRAVRWFSHHPSSTTGLNQRRGTVCPPMTSTNPEMFPGPPGSR